MKGVRPRHIEIPVRDEQLPPEEPTEYHAVCLVLSGNVQEVYLFEDETMAEEKRVGLEGEYGCHEESNVYVNLVLARVCHSLED